MTTGSIQRQIRVTTGSLVIGYGVIEIDIPKTLDSDPSEATVKFRNLSLSTEAQFVPKATIKVEAGQERLQQIFQGQILRTSKAIEKPDTVFTVHLTGYAIEQETDVAVSYSQTTLRTIVLTLIIREMKLPPRDITPIDPGIVVDSWAFQGPVSAALHDVLTPHHLTWYIDEGAVSIAYTGMGSSMSSTLTLNADTGMVGSPEATDTGAKVKVLMDTPVTLNQLVRVESSTYTYGYEDGQPLRDTRDTQTYKVFGMRYSGDNWSGSFTNELELNTIVNEMGQPTG